MLTLRIALRYLFSKKSHNAVNVISIVSILGIAIATAAIVCVLSIFNGFSDLATNRVSRFDPQIKISPIEGKIIDNADSLTDAISRLPQVRTALPTVTEQAVAMFRGAQMAVTMHGVPEGYTEVTDIKNNIIDGEYLTAETDAPVATLSVGTAMRLKAYPGSDGLISIYVPKRTGHINTANPMASFRSDSLFVGGVYRYEDNEQDLQSIILPLDITRSLLEYDSTQATSIEITLADGVSDSNGIEAINSLLPSNLKAQDRLQQEAESYKMISVEKWITFVMLAFILVIASFNVISTLSMLIIEKKSNMQTLRHIGATSGTIRRIFFWEGWLISLVGGIAGIIIGVAAALAQQYGGFIKLNGDPAALTVTAYPVRVEAADIAIVFLLIAATGMLVGYVSSRFAGRKD